MLVTFDAIGTRWEIDTAEPLDADLQGRVQARIAAFDRAYSRFRPDSLVAALARPGGGTVTFPADALGLFDLYDRLVEATGGGLDPLVGRDLELIGYDADYTLVPADPATRARERARGRARWRTDVRRDGATLTTRRAVVVDVGAAGKGYLVDIVAALLSEAGLESFVVDGGGDMRHRGADRIRVGLEHPVLPRRIVGVAEVSDAALCASATNRRAWGEGLHHVLDGRTGRPVSNVLATWVLAPTAAIADGLATALFVAQPDRLARHFEFRYVRMRTDGTVDHSPDFPGEVFS